MRLSTQRPGRPIMEESKLLNLDVGKCCQMKVGDSTKDLVDLFILISRDTDWINFNSISSLRSLVRPEWHSERALLLFVQDALKNQIDTITGLHLLLEEASDLISKTLKNFKESEGS